MGKRHKWANEIVAWSEGAEIEERYVGGMCIKDWSVQNNPQWHVEIGYEYRIKPSKVDEKLLEKVMKGIDEILARNQPSKEPQYLYAWKNNMAEISFTENPPHPLKAFVNKNFTYIGKIKLEQDDA